MKVMYHCEGPGCGKVYKTKVAALKCEDQKESKILKVGEIFTISYRGFQWFDGDKRWVSNPKVKLKRKKLSDPYWKPCPNGDSNCFSDCCNYSFYYVVTAIDEHAHRVRYHVSTKAIIGNNKKPWGSFTYKYHRTLEKVKKPPRYVTNSSEELIGKKFENLL